MIVIVNYQDRQLDGKLVAVNKKVVVLEKKNRKKIIVSRAAILSMFDTGVVVI